MITWPSRAWDRYRPEHPHRSRGPMRTGSLATNKSFQKKANWTTVVFCDQAWTKCPWLPWGRRKLAILVIACMEDRNSEETLQMCRAQQSGQAAGPWNCRCWSVLSTTKLFSNDIILKHWACPHLYLRSFSSPWPTRMVSALMKPMRSFCTSFRFFVGPFSGDKYLFIF